jgi:hypothetical protein
VKHRELIDGIRRFPLVWTPCLDLKALSEKPINLRSVLGTVPNRDKLPVASILLHVSAIYAGSMHYNQIYIRFPLPHILAVGLYDSDRPSSCDLEVEAH